MSVASIRGDGSRKRDPIECLRWSRCDHRWLRTARLSSSWPISSGPVANRNRGIDSPGKYVSHCDPLQARLESLTYVLAEGTRPAPPPRRSTTGAAEPDVLTSFCASVRYKTRHGILPMTSAKRWCSRCLRIHPPQAEQTVCRAGRCATFFRPGDRRSNGHESLKKPGLGCRYYPHLARAPRKPSRYPAFTARYCTRRERQARSRSLRAGWDHPTRPSVIPRPSPIMQSGSPRQFISVATARSDCPPGPPPSQSGRSRSPRLGPLLALPPLGVGPASRRGLAPGN